MGWILIIILLAWPVVEITVFVQVAEWIGWLGAILCVVLSGMAGMALLRREGLATANQAQAMFNRGELPVRALFDAATLTLAGLLLMLPGFVTDLLALPLLLAPFRSLLYGWLAGRFTIVGTGSAPSGGPTIIEGEWREVPPQDDEPPQDDQPRRLR